MVLNFTILARQILCKVLLLQFQEGKMEKRALNFAKESDKVFIIREINSNMPIYI